MPLIKPFPEITTPRLLLRGFTLADAPVVQELVGEKEIAANTLSIPYPYPAGAAELWISTHQATFYNGQGINLAITLREEGSLIGAVGLVIHRENENAEMGYWVGKGFRNQGYCTEAVRALIQFGFLELGLNRIYAQYFTRNPASGRVMEKAGLKYEGCLREHQKKWDVFEDLVVCGMLRSEFEILSTS